MFIKPEVLQTSKSFMVIILMLCIRKLPHLVKKNRLALRVNVSQFLPRLTGSLHHYHDCGADFHSLNKISFYVHHHSFVRGLGMICCHFPKCCTIFFMKAYRLAFTLTGNLIVVPSIWVKKNK